MTTTATDDFAGYGVGLESPYNHAANVTPDDANDLVHVTRAVFIGGAGALKVDTVGGETLVITGLTQGTVLRLRAKRVYATGTAATNIVALW